MLLSGFWMLLKCHCQYEVIHEVLISLVVSTKFPSMYLLQGQESLVQLGQMWRQACTNMSLQVPLELLFCFLARPMAEDAGILPNRALISFSCKLSLQLMLNFSLNYPCSVPHYSFKVTSVIVLIRGSPFCCITVQMVLILLSIR